MKGNIDIQYIYIQKFIPLCALILGMVASEAPAHGIKPSNILGGAEQHASYSFVRPGLTQTSFAFNGPSSHQAFSSSIGNPYLAQKVLPNVANALAYRNPGLGNYNYPYDLKFIQNIKIQLKKQFP